MCKIIILIVALTATYAYADYPASGSGPYPASGWKPSGQEFDLPQRQQFGSTSDEQQFALPDQQQNQQFNPQRGQKFNPRKDERSFDGEESKFDSFNRQYKQSERQQIYVPPRTYTPAQKYGPPTTTEAEITTTEYPTTTTTEVFGRLQDEDTSNSDDKEKIEEKPEIDQGVYYVYHPSGLLQRISYQTENDLRNMAYMAQLRYQNVDPIKDPIYYYNPQTLTLQRIQL